MIKYSSCIRKIRDIWQRHARGITDRLRGKLDKYGERGGRGVGGRY